MKKEILSKQFKSIDNSMHRSGNQGENNNSKNVSNENKIEIENIETITLPPKFIDCSRSDLVALIARMLSFLIEMNDNDPANTNYLNEEPNNRSVMNLTRFHSRVPPNISVYNYLIRLTKYSSLEHCVLLSTVYYIDLLSSVYPEFKINSLTVHRFLLTATTIASKGLCDSFCTNSHYSKVGGVHCSELNILETEFLRRVNYRIIPRDDNIKLCKIEHQQNKFTMDFSDLSMVGMTVQSNHQNSGFNILDIYYHKIVQLVGSFSASSDKSRKANYTLLLSGNNMEKEVSNNIKENSNGQNIGESEQAISSKLSRDPPPKRNFETINNERQTTYTNNTTNETESSKRLQKYSITRTDSIEYDKSKRNNA
ncbi:hypothetical protein Kpol_1037p30 [Vanderwaltozyma polyspora DSM 70294]|uniref:Cyclin-like domain-containing protein n=1 Tax=Vanderwaltozyma polyspora (strain ATCC 22028 / DSM 70294 / BCRC 21397 / CBS 2163 / NBRC 10782 / NRRL Y-8283 / UCD 57-17) TaxID=436907 RepID=A7TJX2_VANPO|nr:uncharacterized protein Kpol_1037p30 [Vanderwaltozyma polyspora DSM 70294]EDO17434.1 hypothetical protein Kpol_1037p30 [Vanderwaltozyma polyspora DSM 70294]